MLGQQRPPWIWGVTAAVLGVAAATAAVGALKAVAPTVSLSVVYFPVVLLCAAVWGWGIGLLASFGSAAAFNFFHLPPTGRFTIADSRNWIALIAFTIVALSASAIAGLARTRAGEAERGRAEADLAAALAQELLGGADTPTALAATSHRLAAALGLSGVSIELFPAPDAADPTRRRALPLRDSTGTPLARLLVPGDIDNDMEERLRRRVVPTLAALLAVALRRDAIQAEAVETRALRRSDDVKTALLRAVSHDLRTPLTAIVAAGHALGSASLTEEERSELADAVREEGERLAVLVEKLLDLSRLQAGRAVPRQDWLSVAEVIEAARDGLPPAIARSVRTVVDPAIPDIRGDAGQLERALANLLENAGRYSPTVTVSARVTGDRVLISVVDQGPGISAAERDRIFEPFYRVSGEGRGSGLGLAIARGFVEAGGGSIHVDSHPGQGASFVISLPVGAASPPPAQAETRP
ncbi:MAG TPA: ATP-binding protein [Solirubrobacteraceae bacterium]|nr:ATP-binding protein [Solirubrobacteraceae bacterium]